MAHNIEWSDEARSDVRCLSRAVAMHIFDVILRFVHTGLGDVKELDGAYEGKVRLRAGDYRVFFSQQDGTTIIHAVKHRSVAYRA